MSNPSGEGGFRLSRAVPTEKRVRALPAIRISETLENALMRLAAHDDRTLSGYVTATNSTTGTMRTESIGAVCTDIRIRIASGYVGVSEFKLSL